MFAFILVLSLFPTGFAPQPSPATPPVGLERAVARVPARHWLLVGSVAVDRLSSAQASRDGMSISLTSRSDAESLWHEVGHIVLYSDRPMEQAWQATIWPGDKPAGRPVSRYAHTSDREDFAESYAAMIRDGSVADRLRDRFMRSRVFRSGELP